MAGLLIGLELLSTLNEKDECLTLMDILNYRGDGLTDLQLWAVCRECCLALNSVYNSPSMFQTLCITPETLGFNIDGTVCFLDLGSDPDSLYVPPEYDSLGNSSRGHMFSLGMTILYAAVYKSNIEEQQSNLNPDIHRIIKAMTDDKYEMRPDIDVILAECEQRLASSPISSLKICQRLIAAVKDVFMKSNSIDSPAIDNHFGSGTSDNRDSPVSVGSRSRSPGSIHNSESELSSPLCDIISPPDIYCDPDDYRTGRISGQNVCEILETGQTDLEPGSQTPENVGETRISKCTSDIEMPSDNGASNTDSSADEIRIDKYNKKDTKHDSNSGQGLKAHMANGCIGTADHEDSAVNHVVQSHGAACHEDADDAAAASCRVNGEDASHGRRPPDAGQSGVASTKHSDGDVPSEGGVGITLPGSGASSGIPDLTLPVRVGHAEGAPPSSVHAAQEAKSSPREPEHKPDEHEADYKQRSDGQRSCRLAQGGSPAGLMGNESSSEETTAQDVNSVSGAQNRSVEDGLTGASGPHGPVVRQSIPDNDASQDDIKGQLVIDIVKNLGALNERELWSLCRECMLALLKDRHQLPLYISMETVVIETDGHVTFASITDDKQVDPLYLAPELPELRLITDKSCLYGVGAMLWSAADYSLPANEEPALSEQLESLLASMIQEQVEHRPEIRDVLMSCNHYQEANDISSDMVCAALIAESKTAAYSKDNMFIRDILSKELEEQALLHHAKVTESIKQTKIKLKPVSERRLRDPPADNSLHFLLMTEIKKGRPLRKIGRPKEFTVADLYERQPDLLASLLQVTGRSQSNAFSRTDQKPESAFTIIKKAQVKTVEESLPVKSSVTVPEEYSSKATHFTPIEINNRKNIKPQLNLKSQFLTHKQSPSGKTSEIVKNIKELKSKMEKSRTLVQDLEIDAQREDNRMGINSIITEASGKQSSRRSSSTNTPSSTSTVGNGTEEPSHKQSPSSVSQHLNPVIGQPFGMPMALPPTVVPVQYQMQQDPRTGLYNFVPVAFAQNMTNVNNPYCTNQPAPMFPMMGMSMPGPFMQGQPIHYAATSSIGMKMPEACDPIPPAPNQPSPQDDKEDCESCPSLEITKTEYPFSNSHPVRPRQVKAKDQLSKLKRAKSGSSIDYHKLLTNDSLQNSADSGFHSHGILKNGHSQSSNHSDRTLRQRRYGGEPSPDVLSSPSPSLSKDSGICGLNTKGFGDPALMEKLFNSNKKLSRVIHLLRDEFAYDGYMENGVEDLAMADYVMSLTNLSLNTFCGAITEKYNDLYWDENLLMNLYEVVNNERPVTDSKHFETSPKSDQNLEDVSTLNNNNEAISSRNINEEEPKSEKVVQASEDKHIIVPDYPKPKWVSNKQKMALKDDLNRQSGRTKHLAEMAKTDYSTKGMEFKSVGDLSSATYLHNSTLDDTAAKYTMSDNILDEEGHGISRLHSFDSLELEESVFTDVRSKSLFNLNKSDSLPHHGTYKVVRASDMERKRASSIASIDSSWRELKAFRVCTSQSGSLLSKSSGCLVSATDTDVDLDEGNNPDSGQIPESNMRIRRGEVAYYHADVDKNFREEVIRFIGFQDSATIEEIEQHLYEIDQELMLQHRNRQKTVKYFLKLAEVSSKMGKSSDQKTVLHRTTEELEKCQSRITFLDAARKYLEMLYCEQFGLSPDLLYALAKCHGQGSMLLAPSDNPLLAFHTTVTDDGSTKDVLQAGLPLGLMAYLYAEGALKEGFVHEFFYCYRYFVSPIHLLKFIINKYEAAEKSLSPDCHIPLKVKTRSLDLLYIWLDGYFKIDFQNSPNMMKLIEDFIEKEVSPQDSCSTDLSLLLDECRDGCHVDLVFSTNVPRVCDVTDNSASVQKGVEIPKKWKSFKAALQLSSKSLKMQKLTRSQSVACIDRLSGMRRPAQDTMFECKTARRSDSIVLMDYTPQALAEQLTLIEQELFQKSHPVHYLNSKAQGIDTELTRPVTFRTQSLQRLNLDNSVNNDNLFVGNHTIDDILHVLIEHAQAIAFWIASEIINCKTPKLQVSLLAHLIATAKACAEIRNFATCLSILDALRHPLVQNLPTWRSLPSKYRKMLDQLTGVQLAVKCNGFYTTGDEDSERCPTIPCILLFILNLQRDELGGYTLANSMFKWTKLKSIAKTVDQIRIFQQSMYDFQPDRVLQDIIRYRMQTLGGEDLIKVAAEQAQCLSKQKPSSVLQRLKLKSKKT